MPSPDSSDDSAECTPPHLQPIARAARRWDPCPWRPSQSGELSQVADAIGRECRKVTDHQAGLAAEGGWAHHGDRAVDENRNGCVSDGRRASLNAWMLGERDLSESSPMCR